MLLFTIRIQGAQAHSDSHTKDTSFLFIYPPFPTICTAQSPSEAAIFTVWRKRKRRM